MEGAHSATINSHLTQGRAAEDQKPDQGLSQALLSVLKGYLGHPALKEARMLLVRTLAGEPTLAPPVPPKMIPIEYGASGIILPEFEIDSPTLTVNHLINHIKENSLGFGSIKVFIGEKELSKSSLIVDILKTHQNPVIKFVRHVASAGTAFYVKRGEELDQAVVLGKNKTKMTITFKDNSINPFTTFKAGDLYPLHDNEYFTIHENKQNIKDGDPDETSLNIEENESYFIEIAEVTDHRIAFRAHYLNCRLSKLEISDETDIDDNNGPYKEYITKKEGDNTTFDLPCVLDRYRCYLKITINSLEFETRCAHGLINFSVVDAESFWIYSDTEGKKILNIRDLLDITYDEEETDEDGGYDAGLTIKLK